MTEAGIFMDVYVGKIFVFLLACMECPLEKIEYDNQNYVSCNVSEIRKELATYHQEEWHTKDGKLFVGVRCE